MSKKEKLLVTSNFSFSHSDCKRLVQQTRKNQGLFGKGLMKEIMADYHLIQYLENRIIYHFDKQISKKELVVYHFDQYFTVRDTGRLNHFSIRETTRLSF